MLGFSTNKLRLVKRDGSTHQIEGHVQPQLIVTDNTTIPIEQGDQIERDLPNGAVDRFEVVEATFYHASVGFPQHYQCKTQRTGSRREPAQAQIAQNITVSGHSSRVNINSTDNSVNIVADKSHFFEQLRASLNESLPGPLAQNAIAQVEAMENAVDLVDFQTAYGKFMSIVADHMAVVSPFMPQLVALAGWAAGG